MKAQVFNPYLPSWEYVPDGEPHVFGNRIYVYGSHDRFGAPIFCVNDYVCWSAPIDDLSDWKYEGVIYKKKQDPGNKFGIRSLYAPDVTQGPDGRFYLYYAFDFMGKWVWQSAILRLENMNTMGMYTLKTDTCGEEKMASRFLLIQESLQMNTEAYIYIQDLQQRCRLLLPEAII